MVGRSVTLRTLSTLPRGCGWNAAEWISASTAFGESIATWAAVDEDEARAGRVGKLCKCWCSLVLEVFCWTQSGHLPVHGEPVEIASGPVLGAARSSPRSRVDALSSEERERSVVTDDI